jgi:hypothetical protein
MYGWIWRRLPGGTGARTVQVVLLLVIGAVVLWYVVYPWASLHLNFDRAGLG